MQGKKLIVSMVWCVWMLLTMMYGLPRMSTSNKWQYYAINVYTVYRVELDRINLKLGIGELYTASRAECNSCLFHVWFFTPCMCKFPFYNAWRNFNTFSYCNLLTPVFCKLHILHSLMHLIMVIRIRQIVCRTEYKTRWKILSKNKDVVQIVCEFKD